MRTDDDLFTKYRLFYYRRNVDYDGVQPCDETCRLVFHKYNNLNI